MKLKYLALFIFTISACAVKQPELTKFDTNSYPVNFNARDSGIFRTGDAASDYQKRYQKEKYHKAFAQSSSGSWGWVTGRTSPEYAMEDALDGCKKHNSRYEIEEPCKVVNLNDYWGIQIIP